MVSQESLNKLGIIIKEDFGKEFTNLELLKIGNDLVLFFDTLAKYKHINEQQNDKTRE